MKQISRSIIIIAILALLLLPTSAFAQSYLFRLDKLAVDVFWNENGSSSIYYTFVFTNAPGAHVIDFVDVGIPNNNFNENEIQAFVNGQPVDDISRSGYYGSGTGVAVGLGAHSISPGQTGTVEVFIPELRNVLYPDSQGDNYASAVFAPTYFGAEYVQGNTEMIVVFHLPPGVSPEEPRWHKSPSGFPEQPETNLDSEGRVMYTWYNPSAQGYKQYTFGASFPSNYVPSSAIVRPSFLETIGVSEDDIVGFTLCCGFIGLMALIAVGSTASARRRKLQYLPPKIAIEGHGIKRGLTAVEAAILLEQPMDKILTMILFACIKKGAAQVTQKDPLEIQAIEPLPEGLRYYEIDFIDAFKQEKKKDRREALQNMMVKLVKNLAKRLKGFSRKETVAYYKNIVERAWAQVEASETPEVKSQRYDEVMEWTMLDKDYDERTKRVFRGGPVIIPTWWGRYDPVYRAPKPSSLPGPQAAPSGGKGISLPHLPGSDFAASMVNSVESFSAGVVGNLVAFTGGVTNKTNPLPKPSSSSYRRGGGGGSSCACACACACAGCACACAGGGR